MNLHISNPLLIGQVEVFALDLPLHTPINLGGRFRVELAELLIARIETGDGLVGWGECAPAPYLGGETREALLDAATAKLIPAIAGRDARDADGLMAGMDRAVPGHLVAKAAIDTALYDLVGRARGVPVCELLGGAKRKRLDAMWMVGTPSVEQDAAEATKKKREGYRVFKLKVGSRPLEQDLAATRAVR
jgi:muconate cycloisomerase